MRCQLPNLKIVQFWQIIFCVSLYRLWYQPDAMRQQLPNLKIVQFWQIIFCVSLMRYSSFNRMLNIEYLQAQSMVLSCQRWKAIFKWQLLRRHIFHCHCCTRNDVNVSLKCSIPWFVLHYLISVWKSILPNICFLPSLEKDITLDFLGKDEVHGYWVYCKFQFHLVTKNILLKMRPIAQTSLLIFKGLIIEKLLE